MDMAVNRLTAQSFNQNNAQSSSKAQAEAMAKRMVVVADKARLMTEAKEVAEQKAKAAEEEAAKAHASSREVAAALERERVEIGVLKDKVKEWENKVADAKNELEMLKKAVMEKVGEYERDTLMASKAKSDYEGLQVRYDKLKKKNAELTAQAAPSSSHHVAKGGDRALRDELTVVKKK